MNLTLDPYVGVGPIKLGMSVAEVRRILGPAKSFLKTPTSEYPIDAYAPLGIHVHYDASGTVKAIEVMKPADPAFKNIPLLGRRFSEVLKSIAKLDPAVQVEKSGLTSFTFGLGLYAPAVNKDPNELIEGIIIFRSGYYD